MKGILIVAHGSRAEATKKTFEGIVDMVREKMPQEKIRHAYMEFSEESLDKGVDELVAEGVNQIKVIPYFLFSGIHILEDIPEMIAACKKTYPEISIELGQSLGQDPRLADLLVERIQG